MMSLEQKHHPWVETRKPNDHSSTFAEISKKVKAAKKKASIEMVTFC